MKRFSEEEPNGRVEVGPVAKGFLLFLVGVIVLLLMAVFFSGQNFILPFVRDGTFVAVGVIWLLFSERAIRAHFGLDIFRHPLIIASLIGLLYGLLLWGYLRGVTAG